VAVADTCTNVRDATTIIIITSNGIVSINGDRQRRSDATCLETFGCAPIPNVFWHVASLAQMFYVLQGRVTGCWVAATF